MANPSEIQFSEGFETLRLLSTNPAFTAELAEQIRKPSGADRALQALQAEFFREGQVPATLPMTTSRNPFELSVEAQLHALQSANQEQEWGIADETITQLRESAPAWPSGSLAFRTLRIRWGHGREGVLHTFLAHVAQIKSVFETTYPRLEQLFSGRSPYRPEVDERLRLLVGNEMHEPVTEWVIIDLDRHRSRRSIRSVRGPLSLADELLVFAWMFPNYVIGMDYQISPGLFAAGYELHVPESDDQPWASVPKIYSRDGGAGIHGDLFTDCLTGYSVPELIP